MTVLLGMHTHVLTADMHDCISWHTHMFIDCRHAWLYFLACAHKFTDCTHVWLYFLTCTHKFTDDCTSWHAHTNLLTADILGMHTHSWETLTISPTKTCTTTQQPCSPGAYLNAVYVCVSVAMDQDHRDCCLSECSTSLCQCGHSQRWQRLWVADRPADTC